MSDEMKLLQALCEALGFLVNVETDYQDRYLCADEFLSSDRFLKINSDGRYVRNEEDLPLTKLKDPIVTYKLIKKEDIKGELVK